MSRVGSGLGVRAVTDGSSITEASVSGNLYRGYELIARGRDPRDVPPLVSRSCGWCGGVHMTAACMALEMAAGLRPPPMALALRTIAQCTEAIWVQAAHLAVRAGPDYCAPVMERTSPEIWRKALSTIAPRSLVHGYATIADLMESLTPVSGSYWSETIPAGRRVQEMISLLVGKFPHPSVMSPGTVAPTIGWGTFTEYYTRLYMSVDYVKKVCALWDDLIEFLYEADERFLHLGERPASFLHAGCWDDVRSDYSWESLDANGATRLAPPGALINGSLATNLLSEVHSGIEESLMHSFYARDDVGAGGSLIAAVPSDHPWFASNRPMPAEPSDEGPYSWCTSPRWRDEVVESTPLGRMWLAALNTEIEENAFIECTGSSVRILVPMNFTPEAVVEWKIPERNNALERLRAGAYGIAFAGLSAAVTLLKGFELQRSGEMDVSVSSKVSKDEVAGVGLWESGRGIAAHWVHLEGARVHNYQIIEASTFNASPRDDKGRPGPLEEALLGSPVIEEPVDGRLSGIDAMRVVRSFDPCMTCGIH